MRDLRVRRSLDQLDQLAQRDHEASLEQQELKVRREQLAPLLPVPRAPLDPPDQAKGPLDLREQPEQLV